jgi:hypothetical protein
MSERSEGFCFHDDDDDDDDDGDDDDREKAFYILKLPTKE